MAKKRHLAMKKGRFWQTFNAKIAQNDDHWRIKILDTLFTLGVFMNKINRLVIGSLLVATLLTACNKAEEPAPASDSPKPTTLKSGESVGGIEVPTAEKIASVSNDSPTVAIWTGGMKLGTTLLLLEENPELSDAQKECLMGAEANKVYFDKSKAEMLMVLGEDGILVADEFYRSEVGQKVQAFSNEQIAIASGEKIANPIKLTEEEQQKMQAFMQSDIMKKMQENIAKITPEKMEADLAQTAKEEMVRCKIESKKGGQVGDDPTKKK